MDEDPRLLPLSLAALASCLSPKRLEWDILGVVS